MEDEIKNRILTGAEELFMKYGVRSVSMDDIARHLSVSKKTLYQYFIDKDEIVMKVAEGRMERDKRQHDALRAAARNAIEELVKLSVCLKQDFQKMNPAMLFDLQKYHPKAWTLWVEYKQGHIKDSIVRNLRQGMEEGNFRSDINVEVMAAARLELVQLTFDDRVFPSDKFNLAEVNQQLFDHFVLGLLTDKGRKAYEKYKQQLTNTELMPQSL